MIGCPGKVDAAMTTCGDWFLCLPCEAENFSGYLGAHLQPRLPDTSRVVCGT
ncbi:hypothetical protein ACIP8Z_05430 [Streptomyces sp. NPDC088553]|uniref:hypothetical protein n=1 Tax=Streptomyces sp. NPDC088553 TaxID=3365864 RepID=UPI00381AF1D4